jgi:hypothetical protein
MPTLLSACAVNTLSGWLLRNIVAARVMNDSASCKPIRSEHRYVRMQTIERQRDRERGKKETNIEFASLQVKVAELQQTLGKLL